MSATRVVTVAVAFLLTIFIVRCARDPLRTALPFGTTDLSSVQIQLNRLPEVDRARVEAYVKRSNGDVLLPSMADPDQPFTARSFGEAVELEKKWEVKRAEQEAVAASHAAERDAAMAPLRAVVDATVRKTEILSARDLAGAPAPVDGPKRALPSNEANVFVVTVSIHNLGARDIVGLKGSLDARKRDAYLPLDLYWIDIGERDKVEAASRTEIRCANRARSVDADQRAFMEGGGRTFDVVWNPKTVVFADSTRLDSGL